MRSLQLKFSLLVVTLLTLACAGLAWIATENERRGLEAESEKRARLLARNLAGLASQPLLLEDELSLTKLLKQVGGEEGVVGVRVIEPDGTARHSLSAEEVGQPAERLVGAGDEPQQEALVERRDRVLVAASAMRFGGVEVGEAQVELDLGELVDPVVSRSTRQFALVAAAVMLLGVVAGVVFVAFLVEPLRRLRAGVERLADGDLGVRVPPSSRDEVGELTRAFNAMGESLQQKERIQKEFGRYVDDYVLERLLQEPEGEELRGVEREVTILFADLRGFTQLSSPEGLQDGGMKAREVVQHLNEFFQLASDCILAGEGTIDKFIGDSVMAYFGAPIPQADHASRAVATAEALQRAVARRNLATPPPDLPFRVGVGIHTGMVVVGNIGSKRRADFTAIGDAVNVAHRLEKLARPDAARDPGDPRGHVEILVSEEVKRRAHGAARVRFDCVGELQLSGRNTPVLVYRVESRSAAAPVPT